jgi:FkbM family methyltransferase
MKKLVYDKKYKTHFCYDPLAYDVVERYARDNFFKFTHKTPQEVENIVIVGGYHGNEIDIYNSLYPNANYFVFEPHPRHFPALNQRYGNRSNVFLYKKAVSSETGQTTFYDVSGEGQSSLLRFQGHEFGSITHLVGNMQVETIRLDDVKELKNKKIDFMQVDVQGGELLVLEGAKKTILNTDALMLECHTEQHVHPADKEPYKNQCYLPDLINYFKNNENNIRCHSVGLDNEYNNGQGNSFWHRTDNPQIYLSGEIK